MLEQIKKIEDDGLAAIAAATNSDQLEELRITYLGRKAELPQLLRGVAELPPEERGKVGKAANQTRQQLEVKIETKLADLSATELAAQLATDRIDVTLPASPAQPIGGLHLLTTTRREIEDVFVGLGFRVMEGPEIELVEHNFDALNHDIAHPARSWTDTFYVSGKPEEYSSQDVLLRTHTSPMQIRAMKENPPPLYIIVPGRVYRRDSDATHTPQFHQIEGLAVDENITLADLQGTLKVFAEEIFGGELGVRLRPHFFPFTEPSVEIDVGCFQCKDGYLKDGSRCNLCKGSGWIEILGAGMVDPNVFGHVAESGYDPDKIQGFAFGMGVERIAMLKHGIPDLRLFYDNDVRFLEQFGGVA